LTDHRIVLFTSQHKKNRQKRFLSILLFISILGILLQLKDVSSSHQRF
jgi:hypothetical protein